MFLEAGFLASSPIVRSVRALACSHCHADAYEFSSLSIDSADQRRQKFRRMDVVRHLSSITLSSDAKFLCGRAILKDPKDAMHNPLGQVDEISVEADRENPH